MEREFCPIGGLPWRCYDIPRSITRAHPRRVIALHPFTLMGRSHETREMEVPRSNSITGDCCSLRSRQAGVPAELLVDIVEPMIFTAGAITAVYCCALFGWGRFVRRLMGMADGSWAVTIALGMALWVSIGGVLNLARLAGPWSLTTLVVIGILLFLLPLQNIRHGWPVALPQARVLAGRALLVAMAVGVLAFTVATQLPPAVYNFHDDFEKYLSHPMRMLQTGTLFGSPLSALGSETLGGQAFLQGFIVAHFPIQYINGFDAVFALFLCLLLIVGFAWRRPAMVPAAAFAMAVVVAINPQYVNVSAFYSASALMMAAIFLAADPAEHGSQPVPPPVLGLVYAAAVALKPTFALFGMLHVLFLAVVVAAAARKPGRGLAWSAGVAGWGLMFLAPWIALHGSHYVSAIADPVPKSAANTAPVIIKMIDIFSTRQLPYGETFAHYTGLMVATLICTLAAVRPLGRVRDPGVRISAMAMIATGVAVAAGYFAIIQLGGPLLVGYAHALRYFIPVLIASVPAMLCLAALHLRSAGAPRRDLVWASPPVIVALIIVAFFSPSLDTRIRQAVNMGSILSFPYLAGSEPYLRYNQYILSGVARKKVRSIQNRVPASVPVIAWINAPFHLDYRRNPIVDVDIAGLATPWAKMPAAQYVMWEYRGYGVRSPQWYADLAQHPGRQYRELALRGLTFARRLENQSQRAEIIYDDGGMALFRLLDQTRTR